MRTVQLGRSGLQCLVDDEDFDRVSKHGWCLLRGGGSQQRLYAQANVCINGQWKRVLMHRFILGLPAGVRCDHIDNNGLNNQRHNLRRASAGQNQHNQGPRRGKYKGVSWHRKAGKWIAQICKDGVRTYLGLFDSEEDAARAYDVKAKKLHGRFAKLNFHREQT